MAGARSRASGAVSGVWGLGSGVWILGEAVVFRSSPILAYAAVVAACFHLFVVLSEEPSPRRRLGPGYDAYCTGVPRSLPEAETSPARLTS